MLPAGGGARGRLRRERRLILAEMADAGAGVGVAQHLRRDLLVRTNVRPLRAGFDHEVDAARADPENRAVLRRALGEQGRECLSIALEASHRPAKAFAL